MRYSKLLFFFTLSLLIAFSSCKKEEIHEMEDTVDNVDPQVSTTNALVFNVASNNSSSEGLDLGCFSIDLPFDLIVDGNTVTINSEEDFETAITPTTQYVDFAYPLGITYPDGETDSIADGEQLGEAFASCIPDGGWSTDGFPAFLICELNSCYQMVYPVNVVDGDGNVSTANNEDEFIDLIANNPELYFEFPISLTDVDGNVVTADDDEDLFELFADCDNIYDPGNGGIDTIDIQVGTGLFGCYELQYPVDVVDEDGNVTTINNEDEFMQAWLNGDFIDFAFPLTLIDEDGNPVVFNNHEELCDAVLECYDIGNPIDGLDFVLFLLASDQFDGNCYSINYPFNVNDGSSGNVITINDATAAEEYLNNQGGYGGVELPVDVTLLADGVTVTIEEMDDFFEILSNCQ